MDVNNLIDNVEQSVREWRPRDVLRRTNWLYRVDALRPRDIREMNTLKELVELYQTYAEQFVLWAQTLTIFASRTCNSTDSTRLQKTIETIVQFSRYLLCEGYCFYLDYLQIAFYPCTNRITRSLEGDRFPPLQCHTIELLGENESRHMTGLSVS